MLLSDYSDEPPEAGLKLLFLHHSVGGQLLADPGPTHALADSIYASHQHGGGLRRSLVAMGYDVHEASYGSAAGHDTDLFDWLPKFAGDMDRVLRVRLNDDLLSHGSNQIVLFKSCYPNNRFIGAGAAPGAPAGPELTVWNAKASFEQMLAHLRRYPEVLFVYLTAPPNAPGPDQPPRLRSRLKALAKAALGRPTPAEVLGEQARLAREFNTWAAAPEGWLKGYPLNNVAVFDYFSALTGPRSDLSAYPSGDGTDSHPRGEGQQAAARALVPFINRAVRRAGLSK
jgi:lysophospholipase L1-like esterase